MAHIERRQQKRPDGSRALLTWRARYIGADGKERSKTFKRKVDAERWVTRQEAAKAAGTWVDPEAGRITVGEWADQCMAARFDLKPKTRVTYESLLKTCIKPTFGETSLSDIKPLQVDAWVATLVDRRLSASRIRQAYNLLGAMLKRAMRAGLIVSSPCVVDKLPRITSKERRALTAEEVARLTAATEPPYDLLVLVLAYVGIRYGEAAALRRGRCNLLRNRLLIAESLAEVNGHFHFGPTKTHQDRVVVVPKFVTARLEQHLEEHVGTDPSALVFTSSTGGPLRYSSLRRRHWDPAVERAGLQGPLPVHSLRHTYASLAAKAGASVKMIQTQLGHRDPALTLRVYQHLFEDDLDGLGDRLDEQFGESHSKPVRPGDGLSMSAPVAGVGDNALTSESSSAPGKIRTCAHGLGNRCSIP